MLELIERAGGINAIPQPAYRKSDSSRRNAKMDGYALTAWCVHVLAEARSRKLGGGYKRGSITLDFLGEVARLGRFADGPRRAREFLSEHGIALVVAKHLPKTYLDGAAMMTREGTPVVGMTIRYDRLDNFWFCLLHELTHLARHLDSEGTYFVDDLSLRTENDSDIEKEADAWANEALIPDALWASAPARFAPTVGNVIALSQQLEISPAAIAGRVRYENRDYRLLSQLVGNGEVRKHFEEFS
jgi:HTH-type transcriptional regulator/antitoxin HigA